MSYRFLGIFSIVLQGISQKNENHIVFIDIVLNIWRKEIDYRICYLFYFALNLEVLLTPFVLMNEWMAFLKHIFFWVV